MLEYLVSVAITIYRSAFGNVFLVTEISCFGNGNFISYRLIIEKLVKSSADI